MRFSKGWGSYMLDNAREFLVLAKELNFVRAAETLHVSQPTLTRHIAYLEQELGFRLFNRNPMALTEAGQSFYASITGIIDQLDAAVDRGRRIAAETSPGILVNLTMSSSNKWSDIIYEAMTVFHEKYPYAPMPRLFQDHSMGIAESVFSGKAAVGLVFTKPTSLPEGFRCVHLIDVPLMVYLHRDNPLAQRESVTVEDLRDCHLICPSSPYLRSTFEGAVETMREHGIEPQYRVRELDEFDRIPFSVQHDEMLLKTDQPVAEPPATFLRAVPFADPKPHYHVYAVYREDARGHVEERFVEICRDLVRQRYAE